MTDSDFHDIFWSGIVFDLEPYEDRKEKEATLVVL